MRQLITMVLMAAGLAVGAQTVERVDNFKKQISRTSFVFWEWVDKDSTRAFQDTIPGITKLFHKDNEPGFRMDYMGFYYDLDPLYNDETMKILIRDWLSLEFDSMYYHDVLVSYNEFSADSLKADFRKNYGVMWNEPYVQDSMVVSLEEVVLKIDTLSDGQAYMHMSYIKIIEDSTEWENEVGGSLYDFMEMDESEMFGVLVGYDFSGQWLGRVHNVVYDTLTYEPLNYYTMDSMMVVEFPSADSGRTRIVQPVIEFKEGALSGGWNTTLKMGADSSMYVHANYSDPYWGDAAKLIWVDQDTLKYIIEVAPVANEAMGNEIKEGQGFAWVWEFARIKGIKEE
jgi:hypothetical protein